MEYPPPPPVPSDVDPATLCRRSSITGDNAFGYPFLGAQGVGGFQKTVLLTYAFSHLGGVLNIFVDLSAPYLAVLLPRVTLHSARSADAARGRARSQVGGNPPPGPGGVS